LYVSSLPGDSYSFTGNRQEGEMFPRCLLLAAAALGLWSVSAVASDNPPSASGAPVVTGAVPTPPVGAGDGGFEQELAERLVAGANLTAAEREDRAALAAFYAARNHELVWVGASGLTSPGQAVVGEIRRADDWGLEASAFRLPPLAAGRQSSGLSRAERADAEVAIGLAILKYARHARGSRSDPTTLSKFLDRKLPLLDPREVITAAAKADAPDAFLRWLHPRHPQFEALRQKYLAARSGRTDTSAPAAEAGDATNKSAKAKTATTPAGPSARKLLVNMEAWRWMPESLGDFYVWVNVPEFTLRVVKDGRVIHTERVVVGKRETPTPALSQDLEQVIFQPFWGIPESIKKQDVLPSLVRGSTRIFTHYRLRIQRGGRDVDPATVDWSTADIRSYHVFQPPGENSVLGNVKFRFPNKHDVYMHDTSQKQLFNAEVRAFSHGCMRVRNPERLAELVLADEQGWPANRVAAAFRNGPQNNAVTLTRKVPVHITYFTAAVDDDGKLKLFGDIYDHESKIALGMEGKAHLIPRWKENATAQADVVGSLAETTGSGYAKKDPVRRAFEAQGGL
jgi:L,D-transpeptidase YcbB